MHTAAHLCSAALLAWLALGANPLHAAAPGEDPVVLNKPVDYLRLPTAKQPTSSGLDTVTDIPINVKAKIARYEAMSMTNAPGISTEAIYIFHNMLRKLLSEHKPEYISAIWESS